MEVATIQKKANIYTATFKRLFPTSVEKVWEAITSPVNLSKWLAEAETELKPGGPFTLTFTKTDGNVMAGEIKKVQAPHLIEFLWDTDGLEQSTVRWEIHSNHEGSMFVLTQTFEDITQMPTMLAGWQVHLKMLSHFLNGDETDFPWSLWDEWHQTYAEMVMEYV
ncbi:hypothetical protein GCM10008967_13250 [Bacillus carboniphilus]|uniref:Activator of Hsp90 ATPase homologue 1/2-like C-terminal domain-containing protein n=1 Tax=Bacillus carboniphilus TaxID=86663 RepID=A0ABP3FTM6_9BACI